MKAGMNPAVRGAGAGGGLLSTSWGAGRGCRWCRVRSGREIGVPVQIL